MAAPSSRYVIGIDLGTSNIALAYVYIFEEQSQSHVFEIPQWSSLDSRDFRQTMPSFLYYPLEEEQHRLTADGHRPVPAIAGVYAFEQTSRLPSRVISSAKSWLCHGGVDREEKILPWLSDDIPAADRLSPVEASAEFLKHLAAAWDESFAAISPDYRFFNQEIVITVPASFDAVAQQLTLRAAELAGYPMERVSLLEEPQAALYHWLEGHDLDTELIAKRPQLSGRSARVLVCDVGGGTTDFSLFELSPPEAESRRHTIRRIAVSDHILLGGDNIDLTIAHLLEPQLLGQSQPPEQQSRGSAVGRLSGRQWSHLVYAARKLKEDAVDENAQSEPGQIFRVAVPGEGGGLFSQSRTAAISRGEIVDSVLEGFFPHCPADAALRRDEHGLGEWGLPYAADSAITRHLAQFLAGNRVDAVLYNGGTLGPAVFTSRLQGIIGEWQNGEVPVQLQSRDKALAVARGAAFYGFSRRRQLRLIAAGYARSVYLEAETKKGRRVVCILPQGFEPNRTHVVAEPRFRLVLGQPALFQLYSSTKRPSDKAGDVIDSADPRDLLRLPPLQTALSLPEGRRAPRSGTVEVQLECLVRETGLLELYCVEVGENLDGSDGPLGRWQLSFRLRAAAEASEGMERAEGTSQVEPERLVRAQAAIDEVYGKKPPAAPTVSAKRLFRELEQILGKKRSEWELPLLRALWEPLSKGVTRRGRSLAHETTWLALAGYILRPGYGDGLDPWRIDGLWRCFELGPAFPKEASSMVNWWLMWRRTAGGLSAERQAKLYAKVSPLLHSRGGVEPELVRLAGSLERLPERDKIAVGEICVERIAGRKTVGIEHYIWAFGRLSSRVPLYASPHTVVSPGQVEQWCRALMELDWKRGDLQQLAAAVCQACRISGDREREVSEEFRREVLQRLAEAGVGAELQRSVREFVPLDLASQTRLFGEQLPLGLHLA